MHAADLVNQDIVAVARATAERTSSPYFGQALLANRLQPLRGRIERLAGRPGRVRHPRRAPARSRTVRDRAR